MLSPLPRNKRAKHPNADAMEGEGAAAATPVEKPHAKEPGQKQQRDPKDRVATNAAETNDFGQNPFAALNLNSKE